MKKHIPSFAALLLTLSAYSQNWNPVGQGLNGTVFTFLADSATNFLYAGGAFDSSGSIRLNRIGYWDGNQWNPLGPGFNGSVNALEIYDGELFATGDFTRSDSTPLNFIAKWNGAGWVNVGGGLNSNGLALFSLNGNLYAGGNFTSAGGQICSFIAKWDGISWQSLDTNIVSTSPASTIMSIGKFRNELVIGGNFIAGGTANNIALLHAGIWQPLSSGLNSWVTSMRELNNELIVTGFFNRAGPAWTICIAKWDGNSWLPFPGPASSVVTCNTVVNNNLIFGGYFNSFVNGNISSPSIANFNLSAQSWSGLMAGMSNSVHALATIGNTVYAAGSLASPLKNIAKMDATSLNIENIYSGSSVQIFPNPFKDKANLEFDNPARENCRLTIFDSQGRIALSVSNTRTENIEIERSSLKSGLYFFQLRTNEHVLATGKLVIE